MTQSEFPIAQVPPYPLGELANSVKEARVRGVDVIDLGQVNPKLPPSPEAVERLVQASLRPHNHQYSASQGITKLRSSVAQYYQRRFGIDLAVDSEVVVTMGSKEGIGHLLLAILSRGDTVLIPTPSYPVHSSAVSIVGGGFVGVSLFDAESSTTEGSATAATADTRDALEFSEDSEQFFRRLEDTYQHTWPRPKVMILSFPHNPTTAVATKGFFERLVSFAREHGIYLIHDIAYAEIGFDGFRPSSILEVEGAKDIAVEFYSFSKGLNLPGWRVGFCVGNQQLVAALKRVKSYLDFGIFQPLQIASISVLENAEAIAGEVCEIYQARRDVLCSGLADLGWIVPKPSATLFVWAPLPDSLRELGSVAVSKKLLEEAQVSVCPGVGFDESADGYLRFALAETESKIRKAIERMGRVLTVLFVISFLAHPGSLRAEDCSAAFQAMSRGAAKADGSSQEEQYYREAIKLCPSLAEAHYNLGVNLEKQQKLSEAREAFDKALRMKKDPRFYVALGNFLLARGELASAEQNYNKARAIDAKLSTAFQGLGVVAMKQGKSAEARNYLNEARQLNPDAAMVYYNLGILAENNSRWSEAIENYRSATEKDSGFVQAYIHLALALSKEGKYGEADKALRTAAILDKKNIQIPLSLGTVYEAMENYSAARDELEKALGLDPNNARALTNLGIILVKLEQKEAGLAKLKQALEKAPEDSFVRGAMGWVLIREQKLDEAEKMLSQAVNLDDNNAFAHHNLGVIYEVRGNKEGARAQYERAKVLAGNSTRLGNTAIGGSLRETEEALKRLNSD